MPPASRTSGAAASPKGLDPERDAVGLDRRHEAGAPSPKP